MQQLTFIVALMLVLLGWSCTRATTDASTESIMLPGEEPTQATKDISRRGGNAYAFPVATIKKTPCYGRCPVYEATVYSNNRIVYKGKKFTEREGTFEAPITDEQLEELVKAALAADFFTLDDTYPSAGQAITDLPSTITYLKIGDKEKQITNNHDAPAALRAYEEVFSNLLKTLEWKVLEEEEQEEKIQN